PISKLTWDNAAYLSPATAVGLGLAPADHPGRANERVVRLSYRGRTVEAPVWVLPGHADDSVTVHLGYGRRRAGRVGSGAGFDAYALRTTSAPWFDQGLTVEATNRTKPLATTQQHHLMENRDLVRSGTLADYSRMAEQRRHAPRHTLSLYPDFPY